MFLYLSVGTNVDAEALSSRSLDETDCSLSDHQR